MPGQLVQLTYYSSVVPENRPALEDLLNKARTHNHQQHITGALWVCDGYFLQVLEGERGRVSTLYNRIAADPQHKNVVLVGCEEVCQRDFTDWWMALILDTEANRKAILQYSASDKLQPEKLNHERMIKLMRSIHLSKSSQSEGAGSHVFSVPQ